MFRDKIAGTVEVYVDDMVVKSHESQRHIDDLIRVFEILWGHRLCLNADVYAFGLGVGNFLGYMITHQRIEVNLYQISAIDWLKLPNNPKDIQKLTGMIVALN